MANHEIQKLDKKGLRDFGLTLGGIFIGLFGIIWPLLHRKPIWPVAEGNLLSAWPWLVGAILIALALLAPLTLQPVYTAWMKFGLLLGKVMTPLWMGIIFCLLFIPMGVIKQVVSKQDPMQRKYDRQATSYRVITKVRPKENMERTF